MKILVVDDGQLAINSLIRILCRVAPDCDYISAMTTEDALSWMRQGPMDAAFLNLEMPGMNGLALTRMIQKLQPRCNIIVVTEHPEYALEALQIFVSGFLLKPSSAARARNCWPIWWIAMVPPAPTAKCWPCCGRISPTPQRCTANSAI